MHATTLSHPASLSVTYRPRERNAPRILVVHREPAVASLLAAAIVDRVPHAGTVILDRGQTAAIRDSSDGLSAAICGPDPEPANRFGTLARIRTAAQHLPIIAIIPGDQPASVSSAVRAGANAVLLDLPGLPEQLPVVVRGLLESQTAQRARSTTAEVAELDRLKEQISRLERLATIDELTGILNRRGLEAALAQAVAGRDRAGNSTDISFLAIDLDNFKPVNDRFGHPAGDLVLKRVAAILRQHCRRDDIAARTGGDEFIAALPGASKERSDRIAHRLQACFRSMITGVLAGFVDSADLSPTVTAAPLQVVTRRVRTSSGHSTPSESLTFQPDLSIGVYTVAAGEPCRSAEAIVRADQALCRAKSSGKGRIHCWDPAPEVCSGLRSAA